MNEQHALVVKYIAKVNHQNALRKLLIDVADLIRQEPGCVQFDLLEDLYDELSFTIYEVWETKLAWRAHLQSEHMIVLNTALKDVLDEGSVDQLMFVEEGNA